MVPLKKLLFGMRHMSMNGEISPKVIFAQIELEVPNPSQIMFYGNDSSE